MPFDSEGIFSRLHCWEDDRINDIDIVTDHMDAEDDNFADGLSQCFLKNGTSKMEGNFNAGNFKLTNVADGTLPDDAVNREQLDTATQTAKSFINSIVKIGDIKASLQTQNHDNWILCNGQELLRSEYADLFEVIGDKFGSGNGVTTFNVPDYRNKFLRGLGDSSAPDLYTKQDEGLPDIEGQIEFTLQKQGSKKASGAFNYSASSGNGGDYTSTGPYGTFKFLASSANPVYGASNHVTPENYAVNWFIKAKQEE